MEEGKTQELKVLGKESPEDVHTYTIDKGTVLM